MSEIVVGQANVPAVRTVGDLGTWFDDEPHHDCAYK